ncbi:GTP-binding protein Era [Thalassospira sp. MBR-102]|jgi:GTP-binding protein Era|uniref:GTPase Era n=3 Tax=Thalassospira TaxID=168934 RepID=A0ABR5Y3W3_9PROT|nr:MULTISPECIES: GTPase Era [Thalassospira]MBR9779301.1 GTPase Era [Rhodospirillales bacterium]AJD52154.1 GTPase Era [Thalassospira xiamenensis M-5 = DSM 17429]KEO53574.1 GTP-binding protein Era [Thalassospira permensis NBRC 106175]KZD05080.1 GTPase Era [Thalassospira xiamenensis]KZD11774.1 GTPase Era [Thalassospira xiamenensis]|tara:strand:- start:1841 stop:2779 length:939 start_codon:yes stop_codon:yes gene_type:complete
MNEVPTPVNEDRLPYQQRCGFVALVGAPNAGKSTLLNQLVGTKVSIVSPKVQTTRTRVRGIVMTDDAQLVFIDTPGIFAPKRRLDRAMVKAAWNGADDADLVVLVIDAGAGITDEVRAIIDQLKSQNRKAILAMNKVDKVADKEKLLRLSQEFFAEEVFTDVFMISAKKGSGTQDLVNFLAAKMPDGPWMFPEDDVSDMPLRLLAAEITREKLYYQLQQELPYSATVETELWEERKDGSVKLEQTIFVEREGQKAIILGKGGKRIKALGSDARKELEAIFERRVHLFLFVKVRENWGDDPNRFAMWGLDPNA